MDQIKPIEWVNDRINIIDQTCLPKILKYEQLKTYQEVGVAIKDMKIRGAPAIGIAGAFGLLLAAHSLRKANIQHDYIFELTLAAEDLKATRPTAVNLSWAINRMMAQAIEHQKEPIDRIIDIFKKEALSIFQEDLNANKKMGEFGKNEIPKGAKILTHCNAGALATSGYGTALGVIRSSYKEDPSIQVYVTETRPRQQGARLTTWELIHDNIPTTLITDNMPGYLMLNKMIDLVIVGADRIALNGDTANKIGTYGLAVLAKAHKIPFYIAAPLSTIDISIQSGEEIPIEERSKNEVTMINGEEIAAAGVNVFNPAFDVTPSTYITGIITENGVLNPPFKEAILKVFKT